MAFPLGWARRCPLTIQHAQVGSGGVSNFPVLFTVASLPAEMLTSGGANAAQANGGDIRFSSDASGATQLACEIVSFTQNANPVLATAEIWVNVAAISSAVDTTIYVWYAYIGGGQSQPAANAAYGSQAVWSGYGGVWHLGDVALSLTDSSANGNTLTNSGVVVSAGKIRGAASLSGTSYLALPYAASLAPSSLLSIEMWFQVAAVTSIWQYLFDSNGDNQGVTIQFTPNDSGYYVTVGGTGSVLFNKYSAKKFLGGIHHLVLTYDGSSVKTYIDGILDINAAGTGSIAWPTQASWIGGMSSSPGTYQLTGLVDEVRLSNSARLPAWISTAYSNQNAPGTFALAGTATQQYYGGAASVALQIVASAYGFKADNIGVCIVSSPVRISSIGGETFTGSASMLGKMRGTALGSQTLSGSTRLVTGCYSSALGQQVFSGSARAAIRSAAKAAGLNYPPIFFWGKAGWS